jgi:hypothetical protein
MHYLIKPPLLSCIYLFVFLNANNVYADDQVYLHPNDYIQQQFANNPPKPKVIWLSGEVKETVERILEHPYAKLRVKYWQQQGKTVWILEEIGKEKLITTGITINQHNKIDDIKVLVFRESRGWEVKHPFFTQQFKNITAKDQQSWQLNRYIDGITGATLSVNALTLQARMALYLHQQVSNNP